MKLTAAIGVLAATVASVSAQSAAPTVGMDLCCATNAKRAQNGLPALKWSPLLDASAQAHSNYQRSTNFMSHFEAVGSPTYALGGRLDRVGFVYSSAGENLGEDFKDVDSLTTAWMNSPGHRANILGAGYTVCGGAVANPGGFYTINYAAPMDTSDNAKFYTLQCSGSTATGAFVGTPVGHSAQTSTAAPAPAPVPTKAPTAVQPPVAEEEAVSTVVSTNSNGNKVVTVVKVVSNNNSNNNSAGTTTTTPPPVGHSGQESNNTGNSSSGGKCKRVPKGSIAAGKCKPCKKCGSNSSSPFRR
ncbi:hypothetical protein LPJ73_003434 [Coemansia sp. RSA 2703]|nr:hypothetical protein LPJ73_003434 [Coemansia sp. RSA 2703]KAJ2366496.1 hypothetical protein IW150_005925 [Coemansia sp. RSA 2607]KAJ2386947.1 hypothetical protein GGI05_004227 [Coemansia sp. RSA 2603]